MFCLDWSVVVATENSIDRISKNEKYSIYNGNYATIGLSLVANFIPLYAISALHATDYEVGLLNSLPSIVGLLATWIGAVWMGSVSSKKKFCVASISVTRIFYLLIAFIPWIPGGNWATVLILLVALMKFPQSFSDLSWQSLIGDLIPEENRAKFFGNRNRYSTLVGMLSTLIPGVILQQFRPNLPGPYQILFVIGFIASLLEIYYLLKHDEPKRLIKTTHPKVSGRMNLKVIMSQRPYLLFLCSSIVFNLGWQIAWPLFSIYQIHYAHATALWVSLFTVANQVAQILSYRWWGRASDAFGIGLMLTIASFGMATAPILTILSINLYYLILVNLFTGIFVAGVNLLLFNQLLSVSQEETRTSFIANYNIVIGAVGFIAPEIGVWTLAHFSMGSAMMLSTSIRVLGGIAFIWMLWQMKKGLSIQTAGRMVKGS